MHVRCKKLANTSIKSGKRLSESLFSSELTGTKKSRITRKPNEYAMFPQAQCPPNTLPASTNKDGVKLHKYLNFAV